MTPDFRRLIEEESRGTLAPAAAAVLAFARWRALTGEAGVDADSAKAALDRILDAAEPNDWLPLTQLARQVGEAFIREFMRHSLAHGLNETRAQIRALETEPRQPSPSRRRGRRM
ncbi:MAG: hypothetical protein NW215_03940 [Hyphomicrobiales bacterium]|nr:hypothetical protein [Hyphomicrobiales bacterium]